jgi:hypothetical protein
MHAPMAMQALKVTAWTAMAHDQPDQLNPDLATILGEMPQLRARGDTAIDQATDILPFCQKLGMAELAERLQSILHEHAIWHGPKPLHPEQRSGEIFLCNLNGPGAKSVGWKSKRIGEIAYDQSGRIIDGDVPVFVAASEFIEAGQWTPRYTIKD